MTLSSHFEVDEIKPGVFRHIQHMRRIAHREFGSWVRDDVSWGAGDTNFPNVATRGAMLVYRNKANGRFRICPTRDVNKWIEISSPYVKAGANWNQVSLNPFAAKDNVLTSVNTNFDLRAIFGNHYLELEAPLKNGYVPPNNQIAMAVGLNGLTWDAGKILDNGVVVAQLRAPAMRDDANPDDRRPITWDFRSLSGQTYLLLTLPSLAGMAQPVIDPTVVLQPDAADGIDTFILQNQSNFNAGTASEFCFGEMNWGVNSTWRGLIKFVLTGISAPVVVTSASVALYCISDYSSNARTARVYRLKRAWVEGTRPNQNDTPATGATWVRYDTTNNWQTAGAFGANDCEQTDIGTRDFSANETVNEFKSWALTPSAVQDWINGIFANNGILFKMDTELNDGFYFSSSDAAAPANRPKFTVTYTLPGGSTIFSTAIFHSPIFGGSTVR